jgi:hypothetical protein
MQRNQALRCRKRPKTKLELGEAKVWFRGDRLKALFRRNATVLLTAIFSALAVAIVALVTTSMFSDRERANAELAHTLRVKNDIEVLVALPPLAPRLLRSA